MLGGPLLQVPEDSFDYDTGRDTPGPSSQARLQRFLEAGRENAAIAAARRAAAGAAFAGRKRKRDEQAAAGAAAEDHEDGAFARKDRKRRFKDDLYDEDFLLALAALDAETRHEYITRPVDLQKRVNIEMQKLKGYRTVGGGYLTFAQRQAIAHTVVFGHRDYMWRRGYKGHLIPLRASHRNYGFIYGRGWRQYALTR